MSKEKVIVLFSNEYQVNDEKTGRVNEGLSVMYLMTTSLSTNTINDKSKGYRPVKGSLPLIARNKIIAVPGVYEASIDIKIDAKGTASLSLVDLDYISPLSANKETVK